MEQRLSVRKEMMKNNVLITSAGKRVSLTRKIMKELRLLIGDGRVYTCDMNPAMSPACVISDGLFKVPPCTSEDYTDTLLTICIEHQIGLIVPTIDTELFILSANKEYFLEQGICVVISDHDFVIRCLDKRKTSEFFVQHHIGIPEPRDKWNPVFPMFVKPYDGSLSANIHIIRKPEEMTVQIMSDPKLIFQEYIDRSEYKEFSVDMYYGRDHKVKCIVPRERLVVRAGEISKGITRKNYLVSYLKERMGYIPGLIGCICVQLFYRERDDNVVAFEINPRFGGGYPLSYCAGANFLKMMFLEYLLYEPQDYSDDWCDNTLMLRYDDEIIVYDTEA